MVPETNDSIVEISSSPPSRSSCRRISILLLFLTCWLLAGIAFMVTQRQATINVSGIRLADADPGLSFVRKLMLQNNLVQQQDTLHGPAGVAADVSFTIPPGVSADQVAADLAAAGLLNNPELFLNYLQFYGLDARLQAGQFTLNGRSSIPHLAQAISDSALQDVTISFFTGMRLEEMANSLEITSPAEIDAAEFLALVTRRQKMDLTAFPFLNSLGPNMTLEGFLFPGIYMVPYNADAEYLVAEMLRSFDRQVTPAMRQAYGAQGVTLPEAVILASIVERETPTDEEKPRIASVYLNRIRQDMMLQADPTVQYALGYQAQNQNWWKAPLSLSDLRLDHAYNTYVVDGLPPGPIANPGLASLQAVANPEQTDYLFFVLDCYSNPPLHIFSRTYDEHLANAQRCR